jgi:hypothetical protein
MSAAIRPGTKSLLSERPSKTDFHCTLQIGTIRTEPAGAEQITVSEVAAAAMVRHDGYMLNLCAQTVSHNDVPRLVLCGWSSMHCVCVGAKLGPKKPPALCCVCL